jgi:HSP20 family molecular chaperone IbpA
VEQCAHDDGRLTFFHMLCNGSTGEFMTYTYTYNGKNNLLSDKNKTLFEKPNRDDLFYPYQLIFDSFFDSFFSDLSPNSVRSKVGFPRWDIYETVDNWVIDVSVTGCSAEDVNVEILPTNDKSGYKNILKISGKVSQEHQVEHAKYSARELRRSAFERTVYLPNNIHGEPVATIKNGILSLKWKLPEIQKIQNKKIEIKKLD